MFVCFDIPLVVCFSLKCIDIFLLVYVPCTCVVQGHEKRLAQP